MKLIKKLLAATLTLLMLFAAVAFAAEAPVPETRSLGIGEMIAQMKGYQEKGYALILTSHYEPEAIGAVAEKISYLETAKALALSRADGEAFMAAMREAFPEYSGVNYLEMSAGALFQ